jgi:RNA 3'-terminal phosphate cyclase (ATP)
VVTVDGAMGEGGGQILRTVLAVSLCRRIPVRIINIRRARARPGLQPQHLAAVRAAAAVGSARVAGAALGSGELSFAPAPVAGGEYRFAVGTAGSTSLVLQTVLPALLTAPAPSLLWLEGGTHNPLAPPFDFLDRAFVPLINRMGPRVSMHLERAGFYPAGGGRVRVEVKPCARLAPLELFERGRLRALRGLALLSRLPRHIGERELAVLGERLGIAPADRELRQLEAKGPGNALMVTAESACVTEVFTGFGERGVPAERVAEGVAAQVRRYLDADVAVGEHLADQLLLPLALAGGGGFETLAPTRHTTTNAAVIEAVLGRTVSCKETGSGRWRINVT